MLPHTQFARSAAVTTARVFQRFVCGGAHRACTSITATPRSDAAPVFSVRAESFHLKQTNLIADEASGGHRFFSIEESNFGGRAS